MSGWFTDDEEEFIPTVTVEWSESDQHYVAGIEGTDLCLRLEGDTPEEAYENGRGRIEFFLSNYSDIDSFVEDVPSYGRKR